LQDFERPPDFAAASFGMILFRWMERRFPKAKTAFLQRFADVISSAQITQLKGVDFLLRSSQVISNLQIFICPGDTTGDINATEYRRFRLPASSPRADQSMIVLRRA
jgi:hypothetical protein